jgi:hypothetical protein
VAWEVLANLIERPVGEALQEAPQSWPQLQKNRLEFGEKRKQMKDRELSNRNRRWAPRLVLLAVAFAPLAAYARTKSPAKHYYAPLPAAIRSAKTVWLILPERDHKTRDKVYRYLVEDWRRFVVLGEVLAEGERLQPPPTEVPDLILWFKVVAPEAAFAFPVQPAPGNVTLGIYDASTSVPLSYPSVRYDGGWLPPDVRLEVYDLKTALRTANQKPEPIWSIQTSEIPDRCMKFAGGYKNDCLFGGAIRELRKRSEAGEGKWKRN